MDIKEAAKTATAAVETLRQLHKEDQAEAVETLVTTLGEDAGPEFGGTERLWTTGRAAREIGVHRNTVRNWALAGRFPAFRRAGSDDILIPQSQVQRLKELHSVFEAVGGLTDNEIGDLRAERRRARTGAGS